MKYLIVILKINRYQSFFIAWLCVGWLGFTILITTPAYSQDNSIAKCDSCVASLIDLLDGPGGSYIDIARQKAIEACRQAAWENPGVSRIEQQVGELFLGGNEPHYAAYWLERAAKKGNVNGQFYLATLYYTGQGLQKSYEQAAKWFNLAAGQGDVRAQNNLGALYQMGYGVEQDYKKAAEWYQKAANEGDADAQTNLGILYEKGWGVPQDYERAVELYRQGAAPGSKTSHSSNGTINRRAQAQLGYAYYKGHGVERDFNEAYNLLSEAGRGAYGFPWAKVDAFIMQANGVGTQQDCLSAYQGLEKLINPSPYDPAPFNPLVADFASYYLRKNPWLKKRATLHKDQDTRRTEEGVSANSVVGGLFLLGILMFDSDGKQTKSDASTYKYNEFNPGFTPEYWEQGNFFMGGY